MLRLCVSLLAIAFAVQANAQSSAQSLIVSNEFSRATVSAMKNGAGYLVLENRSDRAVTLIGASSPVANKVELHTHLDMGGIKSMMQLDQVMIKPGEAARFEPGGNHLMLLGLNQRLRRGEALQVILEFSNGAQQTVELPIMAAGFQGFGSHDDISSGSKSAGSNTKLGSDTKQGSDTKPDQGSGHK